MATSPSLRSAALAYPNRGLRVLACHWPTPIDLPQFCSCGALDCPTPARHPIGTLTPEDATADLGQLSRWWQAHPNANVATHTDQARICIIELRHPANPDHVLRLLNANRADPGPIIDAGPGVLQFMVEPDPRADEDITTTDPDPAPNGTIACRPAGTLVLLPPSRRISGERLRWIRRLHHAARLPAARPLLAQLADFIATDALNDLHPQPT